MNKKLIKNLLILILVVVVTLIGSAIVNNYFFSFGYLQVESDYDSYKMTIDNKSVDLSKPIKLRAGNHTLKASKEDYKDFTQNIKITRDKISTTHVDFTLSYDDSTNPELYRPIEPDDI